MKIFLVDGSPQGIRIAEVGMWTGQALVAPRTELARLGKRAEVHGTGVYVLVGPSEHDPVKLSVYVGEADDVWERLTQHDSKKDFWTWVVVFVSKDKNLTKAHVRWLESRLVQEISAAKQVDVMNGNEPGGGSLPEADQADMDTFMENVRLLMPLVGLNVLPSLTGKMDDAEVGGIRLTLRWESASATCIAKDGAFIVQKGSTARARNVESLQAGYVAMRVQLQGAGVLVPSPTNSDLLVFAQDYSFESPSAAAVAVAGSSVNGRDKWLVQRTGESYKEWLAQQISTTDE